MRSLLVLTVLLASLTGARPAAGAGFVKLELDQRPDVVLQHQRFVGNTRAQAKREGIITRVPQFYVYFTDQTAAWHLQGFRANFTRELSLTFDRQRRERSMVRLDRLLERTQRPDGSAVTADELPPADVFLLLYRRADCEDCRQVAETLEGWLEVRPGLEAVWIDVWLGRHDQD